MNRNLAVSVWAVVAFAASMGLAEAAASRSKYLTMPDGVKIAVEIWLPDGLEAGETTAAMMSFTRYWRAKELDGSESAPPTMARVMNGFGYAYVVADVRGSGASSGSRATELSTAEIRDFYSIIDAVIKEPWSNGRVGTIGISYVGDTAEMAVLARHPALKVVVPMFTDLDLFTSLLFPGGMRNKIISKDWAEMVHGLDSNDVVAAGLSEGGTNSPRVLGVKPVDGDQGRASLKAAIDEHRNNVPVWDVFEGVQFRDDLAIAKRLSDSPEHAVSLHVFRRTISQANVPAFHWGSWMDAGTADGILARFAGDRTADKYIVGAWGHGARADADQYKEKDSPLAPTLNDQFAEIHKFISPYLDGKDGSRKRKKELLYYTLGSGQWQSTSVWPPKGIAKQKLYLDADRRLSDGPPTHEKGSDLYTVDFDVGTGLETRWSTQLGFRDVYYGDRQEADKRLIAYTSDPLERDTEITGHPVIHLKMSSTSRDGAVFVYLESVAPDGVVTMITEGQLRLIHRRVSKDKPPFPVFGPYHTFTRADALAMVPGEVDDVSFALLPISVLVPKGHSLRISLAGHDKDSFARVPGSETPVLKFERNRANLSFIELPILQQ